MKLHTNIFFFCAILFFSLNSYAQNFKNDPGYSANNYKHPNKAAAAQKANLENGIVLKPQYADVPIANNYKAQNRVNRRELRKANAIETGRAERRNYKQQFAPTSRKK